MKYTVIRYHLNDLDIMSVDSFDSKQDAFNFLEKDAKYACNVEIKETPDEYIDDVLFNIDEDYAHLWNQGNGFECTWHIIEVA